MKKQLLLSLLFLQIVNLLIAQIGKDTIPNPYISDVSEVLNFEQEVITKRRMVERLSQNFCGINTYDEEKGTALLLLFLKNSYLNRASSHFYISRNFRCLTEEQKKMIKNRLNVDLKTQDRSFHALVSLFQIKKFKNYLEQQITTRNLSEDLKKDFLQGGRLSKDIKVQLKSIATLSNLGDHEKEEDLINAVNDIYDHIKKEDKKNMVVSFHVELLRNSLALLNTKNSVVETLYLLEDISYNHLLKYSDTGMRDFSFEYYFFIVEPKTKRAKLEMLAWMNFEKNREKIKELILNDDSIWHDHIIR